MKTWMVLLGVFAVLALVGVGSYVSNFNYGNRTENLIVAKYDNLQNVLSGYSAKVTEAAQVPEMYKDHVKEVVSAAIGGRYGAGGSKAVFQMLREQNPSLDPSLYKQIEQIIESGRDEFKNAQTDFIDVKRGYQTALGNFWGGFWLGVAGYPKIDLTKYNTIKTDYASDAFKTGVDKGIKIH